MILHLILRYLGTDACRRWLRPVRDWNPNDCHRLTELLTSMLVHFQTVQWTLLDEGELNPAEYGWENVAFESSHGLVVTKLDWWVSSGYSGFLPHEDHRNANIGANEHDSYTLYNLFRNRCKINKVFNQGQILHCFCNE